MSAMAMKHLMRCLTEMHYNLRHLRRHLLSCADVERYTTPAPVIDTDFHGNVSVSARVGRNVLFFTVALFRTGSRILPADYMFIQIFIRQRFQGFIDLHHFITEIVSRKNCRRFHSGKSYQLDKMVLHHIPQSSCSIIETATLFNTQILYCSNFYIIDIITVPQRFEDAVGKTESKNILSCFFTEKMIDTINLVLLKDGSIYFV